MAYDKIIDSIQLNNNLTSIANAIREKNGVNETIAFPSGFINKIQDIPYYNENGLIDCNYNENGQFSATVLNNTFSSYTTEANNK
jgi:hypothetical protein